MRKVTRVGHRALGLSLATTCLLLGAGVAYANVTTPYSPASCMLQDTMQWRSAQWNADMTVLTNIGAGHLKLTCPIVKHTSNWTTTDDAIIDASVTIGGILGRSVATTVEVFEADTSTASSPNRLHSDSWPVLTTTSTPPYQQGFVSVVTTSTVTGYYGSSATDMKWRYAEIEVDMGPGTLFAGYSITESGVMQVERIYPGSYCKPAPDNTADSTSGDGLGYLHINDDNYPTVAHWICPTAINDYYGEINAVFGPPIGAPNTLTCNELGGGGTQSYTATGTSVDWPPIMFTWFDYMALSGFECTSSRDSNGYVHGDAKIISIRTGEGPH